jgi:hypothetical protein
MAYYVAQGDPSWTFDPLELERQVAQFAKTQGITTQTGWTAFIAALTSGQSTGVSRGLLSAVKCSNPRDRSRRRNEMTKRRAQR